MNDRLLSLIEQTDRLLKTNEDKTIDRVNAALESAYKQLEKELLAAYSKYSGNTNLLPGQRKLLILNEINTLLQLINTSNAQQIQSDFEGLLRGADGEGRSLATELVSAIGNETVQSFAGVNLAAITAQARDGMDRLKRHSDDFASKASAIVEMNLAIGSGPRKVAAALRQELGITKGRAETIARTETLSALNTAAVETYQRLDVDLIQLIATNDDRICPLCSARNGNVYKLGSVIAPLHPKCRCFTLPFKKEWQKLGLTNDRWSENFRQESIAQMKAATGKEPNYGVSPFEKAAGLAEPPTPIWEPGRIPA